MTLATITALINSKIRNKTPKVLKTEHADVQQAIVNEVFSGLKYEEVTGATQLPTNTIINLASESQRAIDVKLTFCKKGNIVFVDGTILNKESYSVWFQNIFDFRPSTEFMPIIENGLFLHYQSNDTFARLIFEQGNVYTNSALVVPYTSYVVNGFYYVNQ
jgi:hypothetical protein